MPFTYQGKTFQTIFAARRVAQGWTLAEGGCDWEIAVVRYVGDDEWGYEPCDAIEPCAAELVYTDDRWECAAGHQHVSAEARAREGWEYAEDAQEAARLAKAGVEPRHLVTGAALAI